MKISLKPENLRERIALAFDLIPRPLGDVVLGPLLAKAVLAASSLGVFDALMDRPRTVEEVGAQCGSDVEATGKLLRALYASGYLKWRNGFYGLTRMSQRWLVTRSAKSMHFAVLHRAIDLRFMNFDRYVRTGESRDFHKELTQEDWVCYHSGQASQARLIMEEVSNRSPIPAGASEMLDLGGGHGLYSLAFCQRHPGLHSRVLDLASPLQRCMTTFLPGIHKRVQFEVADIRTAPLGTNSADVVLIANVIHHFDESVNLHLLNRVAAALRPGGIVIVLDLVRPNSVCMSSQIESLLDLYFGASSGAQLWTVDEIRHWQERSGLHPQSPISLRLLRDCTIQAARKP